ncbi:MAG: hypothetical protein IJU41_06025 [Clostridia bacterium]|nr:hypothetical protein [Clostridia bacterium]
MSAALGELKTVCKEKGYAFKSFGLFGVSKNDSGKIDCTVETDDTLYQIKVLSLDRASTRLYFMKNGMYLTEKGENGASDYLWKMPSAAPAGDKKTVTVLLSDREVAAYEIGKNSVVTVTNGAPVFGCNFYTLPAFVRLLSK